MLYKYFAPLFYIYFLLSHRKNQRPFTVVTRTFYLISDFFVVVITY